MRWIVADAEDVVDGRRLDAGGEWDRERSHAGQKYARELLWAFDPHDFVGVCREDQPGWREVGEEGAGAADQGHV